MGNDRLDIFKKFMEFSMSAWINAGLSLISTPLITRFFTPADIDLMNLFGGCLKRHRRGEA